MHRPVVAACFQKKHARLAVSGKTIGEDASCRSRTHDNVVHLQANGTNSSADQI